MLQQSWAARVVGGQLYLRARAHVYHDRGRARTLRQHLDDAYLGNTRALVCHHVGVSGARLGHVSLLPGPGAPDVFAPVAGGALQSCQYCFTDFVVDVRRHPVDGREGAPQGWAVGVTRWHRLGACRSPDDVEWYNYATDWVRAISEPRNNSCGAGMVYQSWAAGGGREEGVHVADAKFAAAP